MARENPEELISLNSLAPPRPGVTHILRTKIPRRFPGGGFIIIVNDIKVYIAGNILICVWCEHVYCVRGVYTYFVNIYYIINIIIHECQ